MLACLLKSLRNRLWMIVLPTLTVGLLLTFLKVPWGWSIGIEALTLLSLITAITRFSYLRHRHEFDHYPLKRADPRKS
ncbi:hypothetical protein FNU79_16205 [Deinococcus detaillensis]|uniref:Uncharacterized protein n=1 Tax=Deinococcus detaillensis TaxID=2592048 RepID=A0A553UKQ8_9DEIO|nr:hypothetical protein [Deinococcus detaillensis]TSA80785.1 hypothetical protein FNU79_16205 [Deinococcus detaillensis]